MAIWPAAMRHHVRTCTRGGWTRSRESEKNALGRANQDVDLSSSLPSLAGLQLLLKSSMELEQSLKYCAIEIV